MLRTKGEKVFSFVNTIFLIAAALVCLTPILYILAASFSSGEAVKKGLVSFWPVDFTTAGYTVLLRNPLFWNSMRNSAARTLLGTAVNLICTCLAAYPLSFSDRSFMLRTAYAWFFFIPSLVSGGLIPTYMVVRETGLMGSIWALVLPGAVPVFYVLVLLNFFRSLPQEMAEAARIDGAGHLRVLGRIYLPLSVPALATICVYAMLNHWNDWLGGAMYFDQLTDFPLMTYLQIVTVGSDLSKLVASTLPVLLVYPVCQRYFTKGLTLGGVKGCPIINNGGTTNENTLDCRTSLGVVQRASLGDGHQLRAGHHAALYGAVAGGYLRGGARERPQGVRADAGHRPEQRAHVPALQRVVS